jgi:release factor glutamine methyltransferase
LVSNPPYIASAEWPTLQPEVRDYDPRLALDGGDDGLRFYRELAREAGKRVALDGVILVEFGDGQGLAVQALFAAGGWADGELIQDYSGRERILIARRSV